LALPVASQNELWHAAVSITNLLVCRRHSVEGRVSLSALLSEQDQDFYPDALRSVLQGLCL
jgi:hypothetical protein